ncbi:hypothetical protein K1719_046095 [Acacia pycnantha]|nr:hypothetical protein K1719_046095 [Acacia pycnantha]
MVISPNFSHIISLSPPPPRPPTKPFISVSHICCGECRLVRGHSCKLSNAHLVSDLGPGFIPLSHISVNHNHTLFSVFLSFFTRIPAIYENPGDRFFNLLHNHHHLSFVRVQLFVPGGSELISHHGMFQHTESSCSLDIILCS